MTKKRYAAHDSIRNSTILPNEVFQLDLRPTAIAVYAYLRRLENADFRCWPSYEKIAEAVGCSKRTVPKYVRELCEKRLVTVEPTSVMTKDGLRTPPRELHGVCGDFGRVRPVSRKKHRR